MSDNGAATRERRPQSGRKNVGVARSKEPIEVINDHFWRHTQQGQYTIIPHINDEIEFRRFIKLTFGTAFGRTLPMKGIEKMRQDILNGKFEGPKYEFKDLEDGKYGYYREDNQTITLNKKKVQLAAKDPVECWTLLLIMLEEFGHHLDYSIRYVYSDIKGDADGDEGKAFANLYIIYNTLLKKGTCFADIKFAMKDKDELKDVEEIKFKVDDGTPSKKERVEVLTKTNKRAKEHEYIISETGEEVKVEYFFIRGRGGVHESITKDAAEQVKLKYDDALDEGCAWPDVPCEDPRRIETCYIKTGLKMDKEGTLAYRSHHGDLSYWHSMFPPGKKIGQIKESIIAQARKWYTEGYNEKGKEKRHGVNDTIDYGLFFVGKLLHMMQDSFCRSHSIRDKKENHQIGPDDTPEKICNKYSIKWESVMKHPSNLKLRSSFMELIKKDYPGLEEKIAEKVYSKKLYSEGEYYDNKSIFSNDIGSTLYIPSRILLFQDYNMQDGGKHKAADKAEEGDTVYDNAMQASARILTFYRDGVEFDNGVEEFLRNEVYVLSTKYPDINFGVTHSSCAKDGVPDTNIYPFKD